MALMTEEITAATQRLIKVALQMPIRPEQAATSAYLNGIVQSAQVQATLAILEKLYGLLPAGPEALTWQQVWEQAYLLALTSSATTLEAIASKPKIEIANRISLDS